MTAPAAAACQRARRASLEASPRARNGSSRQQGVRLAQLQGRKVERAPRRARQLAFGQRAWRAKSSRLRIRNRTLPLGSENQETSEIRGAGLPNQSAELARVGSTRTVGEPLCPMNSAEYGQEKKPSEAPRNASSPHSGARARFRQIVSDTLQKRLGGQRSARCPVLARQRLRCPEYSQRG